MKVAYIPACIDCSLKTAATELNVLFLNSIDTNVWGGLEHWMEMCGVGLSGRGHSICFAGRTGSIFQERMSRHETIKFFPLNISGDFSPSTISRLRRVIKEQQIDVLLCNFVKDARLAGLARKLGGSFKIIWTPGVNLAKHSLSHRWLFSSWVDSAIVPSDYLKNEIVKSGYVTESKFHTIPIGIDETHWRFDRSTAHEKIVEKHNLPDDAFICLTSGRFVPQKGHKYLIEAAGSLAEKFANIYFILLGDGPLRSELDEQIGESELTERFIFPGLLADHRNYVFGCDLYVHPAIVEPYGIVLVEAMAAGLPIVASDVGGIPDVVNVGENAIFCQPADAISLTKAVASFYSNNDMRLAYGKRSSELFAQKYHLSAMINAVEKTVMDTVRR